MRKPSFTRQFEKDLKRMGKRGKPLPKLKEVMNLLITAEQLPERYRDHTLIGTYKGRRECHIEPNWLLIYKLAEGAIIFERTGTHADLFE